MKVYLAAGYSRREELQGYERDLDEAGIISTSRWLRHDDTTPEALATRAINESMPMSGQQFAEMDFQDVLAAHSLVFFTRPANEPISRGGSCVEFGMALAWGKRVMVCGPRQNVFCTLPQVLVLSTWPAVLDQLIWDNKVGNFE